MCKITGNVEKLQNLHYLKKVNNMSDFPDITNVKKLIYTKPGIVLIDEIEYIGDTTLITAFVDKVNNLIFHNLEIKSPEEWMIDPRYKYYSDEYKVYLHKIWASGL